MTKDGIRNAVVAVVAVCAVLIGGVSVYRDNNRDRQDLRNECLHNVMERYTTDIQSRDAIEPCDRLTSLERLNIATLVQKVGAVNGGILGEAHR